MQPSWMPRCLLSSKEGLGGSYPFLILDAMFLKVREGSRVISRAALIAIGVNEKGSREVA